MLPYYVITLLLMMAAGFPVYAFCRTVLLKKKGKKLGRNLIREKNGKIRKREIYVAVFALFMMALFIFLFVFQCHYHSISMMIRIAKYRIRKGEGINMVPFHTIFSYYKVYHFFSDEFFINVIGNMALFVPWGFGLLLLWKKNRKPMRFLLLSLMLPLFIEFVQLFIGRQVDIDDIILNFLGSIIGGLIYRWLSRKHPSVRELGESSKDYVE